MEFPAALPGRQHPLQVRLLERRHGGRTEPGGHRRGIRLLPDLREHVQALQQLRHLLSVETVLYRTCASSRRVDHAQERHQPDAVPWPRLAVHACPTPRQTDFDPGLRHTQSRYRPCTRAVRLDAGGQAGNDRALQHLQTDLRARRQIADHPQFHRPGLRTLGKTPGLRRGGQPQARCKAHLPEAPLLPG
ncbi:hypothetical protein D3C86_1659140 [compost metagenome]